MFLLRRGGEEQASSEITVIWFLSLIRFQVDAFPQVTMLWFGLDKCQVATKATLSLPLLSWTGERRCDERLEGGDKDRERSLTNYHHRQNRLNLGRKESLIHHQSNQSR